ncbi:MAG: CinA-like protein [Candidatus Dichloromethanomonas elyunquensis]|nr:MAG: CinA-like protein [Candidatus Dichloromethanomonas elyunquensis]
MKKIRVQDAVGMTLCHDITKVIPGEFKGIAFKRGHIIQREDVNELLQIGKEHIYIWEQNAGEIHEDEAAIRIAKAIMGPNIVFAEPQEGKTVLKSTIKGLFKVNRESLRTINSYESITVSSRPDNYPVLPGDRLAGARIIPLVIEKDKIIQLERTCSAKGPVFEVKPYQKLKAGIIITGNEVFKGRIEDKFGPVIRRKIEDDNTEILGEVYCPDEMSKLNEAIESFLKKGSDLIILTGGMSVDPDDLTPGAIKNSGARIVTYGAPVQPGNMFMMAYLNQTVLLGVPGAAIYHKTTILDVVLPRIFAGEILTREDFIKMGEGGFCLGCERCRYPMCYFGRN